MSGPALDVRQFLAGLFGVDVSEVYGYDDGLYEGFGVRQGGGGMIVTVFPGRVEVEWGAFDLTVDTDGDTEETVYRAMAAARAFHEWKPTPPGPSKIWIFGTIGEGHHLYDVNKRWPLALEEGGEVPYALFRACDGVEHTDAQPIGERTPKRRVVHGIENPFTGWSLVTWWDRSVDSRLNSHTGVLAKGEWTDRQLVDAARRLAPWAIRVKLGSWAGEVSP